MSINYRETRQVTPPSVSLLVYGGISSSGGIGGRSSILAFVANEIYFLGDLNIDWNSLNCPQKNKLLVFTEACGLTKPTRVCLKRDGSKTSTCIDHIYTNSAELCTQVISIPIGCRDHNLVAIVRKTKVPKAGPKIVLKRSYKYFSEDCFIGDVMKYLLG